MEQYFTVEICAFFKFLKCGAVFCCKQIHPATEVFICSCMDVMEMVFLMGVIRGGSGGGVFHITKIPLVTLI